MSIQELQATIKEMVIPGRGILAADESSPTIAKRLKTINVESTEEARRDYREMLFRTKGLGEFISGVILYEETLAQKAADGTPFVELLTKQNIVPGIKVDKGLITLAPDNLEKVTAGLDGLTERLTNYKQQGARFAKWRAVYSITESLPSMQAIFANAECLARYAAICQSLGIVPIVEPEVLMDGTHDIQRCEVVTERVLQAVFTALHRHRVKYEYMLLKPSMVIAGSDSVKKSSVSEVAAATVRVLQHTVPAAVPSINFLSGGQGDIEATQHLNAMNQLPNRPWLLSFSYGRALQAPTLKTWAGNAKNVETAQLALYKRARLNGAAVNGKYSDSMEK